MSKAKTALIIGASRGLGLGLVKTLLADGWQVTAPSSRFDVAIEEDLIEELARIHGYDRIPTTLPAGASRIAAGSEEVLDQATVRRQLVARGMLENINFAFVDATWLQAWGMTDGQVALANPLSAELAVMRPSLLPGLVAALGRNVARQAGRVRAFELGRVFHAPAVAGEAPVETRRIAAAVCGDALALQWGVAARKVDFHDLKGDLDSLAALSGAQLEYRASAEPFAHPGRSADVYRLNEAGDGVRIGWIGQLHPRLQQALDVDAEVYGFELELDVLLARALPRAATLSKYPSVRRDLAFVVAESVSWDAMRATAKQAAGQSLRELRLFDRYAGKGVETGFKSLAMALILQDESRTLTDRDVESVVAAVVAALEHEHAAVIRR